jgi:serine transporter
VTLGPLIAFIAISSSFLGHFLGARESLKSLIAKPTGLPLAKADKVGIALMFFSIWGAAVINPGILGLMETLSGPVIAMILFIMPVIAIYKVEALARFRHGWTNGFILLTGSLAVSALMTAVARDKKVRAGLPRFVVLRKIGEAVTRQDGITPAMVEACFLAVGATESL